MQQSIPAAETMRVNRLLGLPLPPSKVTEEKERGKMKVRSTLDVIVVRLVDHKVVIVVSNF